MDGLACPCGLGDDYESCCGRLHAGAPAPTAESLMRSRYSAFAVGDAGYLLRTWHPSGRPRTLSLDPTLRWTRLAVLETRDGGPFDATARCSSVPCTSSRGSVASSPRPAGSSGKTDTGPTSAPLTKGRLLPRYHPEGATLDHPGNGSLPNRCSRFAGCSCPAWRPYQTFWREACSSSEGVGWLADQASRPSRFKPSGLEGDSESNPHHW
jgi:SEC-C motif domain protein